MFSPCIVLIFSVSSLRQNSDQIKTAECNYTVFMLVHDDLQMWVGPYPCVTVFKGGPDPASPSKYKPDRR